MRNIMQRQFAPFRLRVISVGRKTGSGENAVCLSCDKRVASGRRVKTVRRVNVLVKTFTVLTYCGHDRRRYDLLQTTFIFIFLSAVFTGRVFNPPHAAVVAL